MRTEFVSHLSKFSVEMGQILQSLSGGISLKTSAIITDALPKDGSIINLHEVMKAESNLGLVKAAEELLEGWSRQIETFIEHTIELRMENDSGEDPGPRTELDAWRTRMQRITSITEQLKTIQCRTVLGVLYFVNNPKLVHGASNTPELDKCRHSVTGLLRRWKLLEVSVKEALNEAKDNVKYLRTLQKKGA